MTVRLFLLGFTCVLLVSSTEVGGQCSFQDTTEQYKISWNYDPNTRLVNFVLVANQLTGLTDEESEFWTGLGVGDNMLDADFTVIMVNRGGSVSFRDMYLSSQTYTRPYTDQLENIQQTFGRLIDGKLYANFSRPVDSGDLNDKSFRGCLTFQFPVSGGRISRGKIQMHTRTPIRKSGICNILTACAESHMPINQIQAPKDSMGNGPLGSSDSGKSKPFVQHGQAFQPAHNIQPFIPPENKRNHIVPANPQKVISPLTQPPDDSLPPNIPSGCQFREEGFSLSWLYNPVTKNVEFSLSVPARTGHFWTGVGFGKEMKEADFVVITSVNGRVDITDRHSSQTKNGHSEPKSDFSNNVRYLGSRQFNGLLNVSFARPLGSSDSEDLPVENPNLMQPGVKGGCQYFQFPTTGGSANSDGSINYHSSTPLRRLVCAVSRCVPGGSGSRISEVSLPTVAPSTNRISKPVKEAVHSKNDDACPEPDHPLCDFYFDDYFHKVKEWSNDNGYRSETQIPKACSLVRDLQGGLVTRACCTSFKLRCPKIEEFH